MLSLAELGGGAGFSFLRLTARSAGLHDFLLLLRSFLLSSRTGASTAIIVFIEAER